MAQETSKIVEFPPWKRKNVAVNIDDKRRKRVTCKADNDRENSAITGRRSSESRQEFVSSSSNERQAMDLERIRQIESIKAKLASNETLSRLKRGDSLHIHPLLRSDVAPPVEEKKKFEIVKSDTRSMMESKVFDPRASHSDKYRSSRRQLMFNPHGKYIEQANEIRQQVKMEELKKKIALTSKKVGIFENSDASKKSYRIEEPPKIDWWDSGLLLEESFEKIDQSFITNLVQHPVLIAPPYEKNMPEALSVQLTSREMKKLRRERRVEMRKEIHDKQMLGLIEPEIAKVKIANMYKVFGDAAIKDPTRIEAQVRYQIQARQDRHEQQNLERKLTPEQRREKIERKKEEDANKCLKCCCFKVKYLAHRPHRLKVDLNAQQDGLTGICILNSKFNLIVVEGGLKGIKHYKNLMQRRIDWKDATTPEGEILDDYDTNYCCLIWEGDIKTRNFGHWSFKRCNDDSDALEALKSKGKADHFWNLAKNYSDSPGD